MGGSAREWSTEVVGELAGATDLELRLAMTKFGEPPVTIAYEVVAE